MRLNQNDITVLYSISRGLEIPAFATESVAKLVKKGRVTMTGNTMTLTAKGQSDLSRLES